VNPTSSSSSTMVEAISEIAIEAKRLTKWFGATLALDDVTLSVRRGEIYALVGENGAGKSTLLGILSGRVVPDSGELSVFDQHLQLGNPRASRQQGITAIYQELTMVPALTAEANVFLGQELGPGPLLSQRLMHKRFQRLCDDLEVRIDGRQPTRDLPVAQQQVLEIMRGVAAHARIMLFDEPTAALPEHERESALRLIRRLSTQGVTVIFVSHHLEEVLAISDRTTVLRNGRLIDTRPTAKWTERELVRSMLGREIQATEKRAHPVSNRLVVRADSITVPGAINNISIQVHAGEIVGLAGLVGSGRTTLLRSLAGLEASSHGRLWLDGDEVSWPRSPSTALDYGIALVPEDRKRQGLVLGMSVADNVTLTFLEAVSRFGIVLPKKQREESARLISRFGVPKEVNTLPVSSLSGGNQQRVLIAKWLHRQPLLLLADEPTRGIDVGTKAEVLNMLQQLAEAGMAIVMVSSDLEEVLAVSDRVLVLADGNLVGEMANDMGQLKVDDLLQRAFRVNDD
jgi:ABC-type sugar transport system ATPase subunit